ncbi:hypothetical protein VKT23_010130 [Stygiomarasmius scandens]|uniref:Glucose-methanol-choline oxidoreductase N-terminal domain-containing protein n=1 Tax=Marasmiellus scandens TaxID=2682957 RepID=A0ABR1JHX8_9AGAR
MKTLAGILSFFAFPGLHGLSYDYIVIGGGTGGLTVASRLAENKTTQVLVLEAGPNAENLQEVFVPGLIGMGQAFTTLNWGYKTVPQTHLNNRVLSMRAGKALGGSTVINSMIFPRAEKAQYDAWGVLNKDRSWTWDALLPYFKKSEIFSPPNEFQAGNGAEFIPEFHGFNEEEGRVKVGFPNIFFEQAKLWRETSERLGFPVSPDLSDGSPHAVGVSPASIDAANNTRCSATCAYYTPFADEPNFTVLTNTTVTRIIWDESGKGGGLVASAVEYIDFKNQTKSVDLSPRGEVIISAGTIGSPKVLELSGIGNSSILRAAGIDPVLELPSVGENLAGGCSVITKKKYLCVFRTQTTSTAGRARSQIAAFSQEQLKLWFENRTGLYSDAARSLGITAPSNILNRSTLNFLIADAERNLNYFAEKFSNGNPQLMKGIEAQHRIALELYRQDRNLPLEMSLNPGYSGPTAFDNRPRRKFTSIHSVLYNPLSRGRTHISSSDPLTPPLIDPAYWSHPLDTAAHVSGIKLARKMLTTQPLSSVYEGEFEPGSERQTDEEIEEWLKEFIVSDTHEIGSMAMLPKGLGGVVDTELKIYGTRNVRVVDSEQMRL